MKHRLHARAAHVFILLMSASACAPGAAGDWKAGLAAAVITPEQPVMLAGYSSRTAPYSRVLDDLHVKALALEDGAGNCGMIVTADVVGFIAEVGDPIRQRIAAETGISADAILLNASHTHAGPALMLKAREGGTATEEQVAASVAYTHRFQDLCVHVAQQAAARRQPVRLSFGNGVIRFPMNRREFTARGVILGVNPRGLVDRSVGVLRIDGLDGKPVGVLFRASCHNTTFGSKDNDVSADFAGAAQAYVERALPGVQAMFMQGLAGDTNPYPNSLNDPEKRTAFEIARAHGNELGAEVLRVAAMSLTPIAGPLTMASGKARLPLQQRPNEAELAGLAKTAGSWQKWVAARMLADSASNRSAATHYEAPVSVWQFGTGLTMVALSGEVVVEYVRLLEDALGPLNLWLTAYCNDTFGYVPSARILSEGGYETRGLYSGSIGFFAPSAEQALVDEVCDLAKRAGRIK